MRAFHKLFADTSKVTGTVKVKNPNGTTETVKLARGPVDMSEAAFGDAASTGGATFGESVKDGERTRTRNRKDVTGEDARAAVLDMLGFTLVVPSAPEPAPTVATEPAATEKPNKGKKVVAV